MNTISRRGEGAAHSAMIGRPCQAGGDSAEDKTGPRDLGMGGAAATTVPPPEPSDPLSPFEGRLRKIIGTIMSPPILFCAGCIGICLAGIGFPRSVGNHEWLLATFHIVELIVGFACLIPPFIAILWLLHRIADRALKAAARELERLDGRLKRIFPN